VTDLLGKSAYVSLEPDFTSDIGRNRTRLDHAILYGDQLGSYNRLCDTVRLTEHERLWVRWRRMVRDNNVRAIKRGMRPNELSSCPTVTSRPETHHRG
jgi:hypothetical protein